MADRSWPLFRDLSRCGVANQSHSANFGLIVLKRIEHGTPGSICFQAIWLKLAERLWFATPLIFCNTSGFWPMNDLTLSHYNFKTEARSPKPTVFSESWVHNDSVGTSPEKFSRWKFLGTERFTQKITFLQISVSRRKKCSGLGCAQFLFHRPSTFWSVISIFLAKRSIVAYAIPYIFWKLLFWR